MFARVLFMCIYIAWLFVWFGVAKIINKLNLNFARTFRLRNVTSAGKNKLYSTGTVLEQEQNSNETVYKQERNILVEINKLYVCIDIGKSNLLGMLLLYPTFFF